MNLETTTKGTRWSHKYYLPKTCRATENRDASGIIQTPAAQLVSLTLCWSNLIKWNLGLLYAHPSCIGGARCISRIRANTKTTNSQQSRSILHYHAKVCLFVCHSSWPDCDEANKHWSSELMRRHIALKLTGKLLLILQFHDEMSTTTKWLTAITAILQYIILTARGRWQKIIFSTVALLCVFCCNAKCPED